jgi:hypothetical protein
MNVVSPDVRPALWPPLGHLRDVSAIGERGHTMLRHLAAERVDLTANGI